MSHYPEAIPGIMISLRKSDCEKTKVNYISCDSSYGNLAETNVIYMDHKISYDKVSSKEVSCSHKVKSSKVSPKKVKVKIMLIR